MFAALSYCGRLNVLVTANAAAYPDLEVLVCWDESELGGPHGEIGHKSARTVRGSRRRAFDRVVVVALSHRGRNEERLRLLNLAVLSTDSGEPTGADAKLVIGSLSLQWVVQ